MSSIHDPRIGSGRQERVVGDNRQLDQGVSGDRRDRRLDSGLHAGSGGIAEMIELR